MSKNRRHQPIFTVSKNRDMRYCITIIALLISYQSAAQSMAINATGNPANASAMLDVQSTTKGILIPRMTKVQKNAIAAPATGLLIYQGPPSDSTGFYYYNGSQWVWLQPQMGDDWKTTGNAGTDTAVNFIGTTDNMPLAFRVNNEKSGRIESNIATANSFLGNRSGIFNTGANNTAFGFRSLVANTTGFSNTSVGSMAMQNNSTGRNNVAIGALALNSSTTGNSNVAIGSSALENGSTLSSGNVAIGHNTLRNNNGNNSIGIGADALSNNTSGNQNTAIGTQSLLFNTTGFWNIGLGYYSLRSNITGFQNLGIGNFSLYNNTSGNYNIAIGDSAAYNNTVSDIVAIGSKALYSNTTGNWNMAIGFSALKANTTGTTNTAVGYLSLLDNTTGFANVAIGGNTLLENTIGFANTALGWAALNNNNAGAANTGLGYEALDGITNGNENVGIGYRALNDRNGTGNTAVGSYAGVRLTGSVTSNQNTFIGYNAGGGSSGNNNIFLGYLAGRFFSGNNSILIGHDVANGVALSDILAIDNSSTATPLIFGNFATNLLRINGTLNVNNAYSFPLTDGTSNQVLQTDGAGNVSWGTAIVNANSGLSTLAGVVRLGGPLLQNTTISNGNFNLTHSLNGIGNFQITTPLINALSVLPSGNVGINTNAPQYKLHVINTVGGSGPFGSGIMVQNNNTSTTGEASISFKNSGPDGLPANRAWMTGMNNFSNYVVAYGDSLKASTVKFRIDTTGNISVNPNGSAAAYVDINGDFATRINTVPVNNGMNNDVDPGRFSFIKVTGATAAFSLSGFTGGVDGKILTVVNLTGNNMTIVNQTTSASAAINRINTLTGGDIVTISNGSVTMQYSNPDNRWIVIAVRD